MLPIERPWAPTVGPNWLHYWFPWFLCHGSGQEITIATNRDKMDFVPKLHNKKVRVRHVTRPHKSQVKFPDASLSKKKLIGMSLAPCSGWTTGATHLVQTWLKQTATCPTAQSGLASSPEEVDDPPVLWVSQADAIVKIWKVKRTCKVGLLDHKNYLYCCSMLFPLRIFGKITFRILCFV